jgi:hypothetical protein
VIGRDSSVVLYRWHYPCCFPSSYRRRAATGGAPARDRNGFAKRRFEAAPSAAFKKRGALRAAYAVRRPQYMRVIRIYNHTKA